MQFKFNPAEYPYASQRRVVYANKGMVATGSAVAAQAGLDILKKGGNAIDAAVAVASTLSVVEPTANGIGSDAFALVWVAKEGKLYGLNGSGPSPKGLSLEAVKAQGHTKMPETGPLPVNVPGAPSTWAALSERFGKLEFKELFTPAISYAEDGYVVPTIVAQLWKSYNTKYTKAMEESGNRIFEEWFKTFVPEGKVPAAGDLVKMPYHAKALRLIAETKAKAFYEGEIAEAAEKQFKEFGGYLTKEDMAAFKPQWVEPVKSEYHGFEVHEIPPNGHGITVLMALNILKYLEIGDAESADTIHKQIEAIKLAYADTQHYVADPRFMKVTNEQFLADEYAKERAALIGEKALDPKFGDPAKGGTVYLCTADAEGNMVSYIQSNYMGFGSGVVIPGYGVTLNNRGTNFSMDESLANCVAGGKLAYHTIIPGFLTKDGKAVGPFGVMGGFMQPQGHLQMVMNTVDWNMNPQASLDRPRWQWMGGKKVRVEQQMPNHVVKELVARGHDIQILSDYSTMGRGEIIWRNDEGVLCGGCEPRTDAACVAW